MGVHFVIDLDKLSGCLKPSVRLIVCLSTRREGLGQARARPPESPGAGTAVWLRLSLEGRWDVLCRLNAVFLLQPKPVEVQVITHHMQRYAVWFGGSMLASTVSPFSYDCYLLICSSLSGLDKYCL